MLHEFESKEFAEYLEALGKNQKPLRHKFYQETVDHAREMGVHLSGGDPSKLLDIKRPNEDDSARKYRLASYKPKTKSAGSRAVSIMNRIYNPRLYSIEYSNTITIPDEDNTLNNYLDGGMPYYNSLMNYIKSVFTKSHLEDPGGVVIIQPADFEVEDTQFFEPIPFFYGSEQVLDFDDDHYFVIGFFEDRENYQNSKFLKKVVIYTRDEMRVFKRENYAKPFEQTFDYVHGFDWVPGFRVGGIVTDSRPPILYESFISGVLPHWDDAVCYYSDLAAQIVTHLYPEKWEYSRNCSAKGCNNGTVKIQESGTGRTLETSCKNCHGTGREVVRSPYNVIQINRSALNPEEQLPIPPAGYVTKDLDPTVLLEKIAEKEIEKGFEAVNLDIKDHINEGQSGVAKMIDRQDQDGFMSTYAQTVFNYILPNTVKGIIFWRYSQYLGSETRVDEFMPMFKEPTSFDIYSISLLTEELATLKQSGVSGAVLIGLQKDIIDKRFTDKKIVKMLNTIIDVDPLSSLTEEEIMSNSQVIGRTERYIHTYAKTLVEQAMNQDEDFLNKTLQERKDIIFAMAESALPEMIQEQPIEEEPMFEDGDDQ